MRPAAVVATLVVLCTLIASSGSSATIDASLAAAAAAHLGAPQLAFGQVTQLPRGTQLSVSRALAGRGLHRALRLRLSGLRGPPAGGVCRAALLQPLPSGVFADPYQLADLERASPGARYTLLGPLDLELWVSRGWKGWDRAMGRAQAAAHAPSPSLARHGAPPAAAGSSRTASGLHTLATPPRAPPPHQARAGLPADAPGDPAAPRRTRQPQQQR